MPAKQLIETLTGFFGPSSSKRQEPRKPATSEKPGSFSIPHLTFAKGFMLFNPNVHSVRRDIDVTDAALQALADTHASTNSIVADHLRDPKTDNISMNDLVRNDGSFCISVEYRNNGIEWNSVIIGQFNQTAGLVVHDVVTGFIGNGPNLPLYLQEAFCLHSASPDGYIYATPTDSNGFKNALCHANHSFLQIISGAPLHLDAKQKWIEANELHSDAKRALRRMQIRTLETATEDANMIMWLDLNLKLQQIGVLDTPIRKPV